MPAHERDGQHRAHQPQAEAEARARERRHARDPLCHTDGEGVEERRGEPYARTDERDGRARNRVVPKSESQRDEDQDERHGFLRHTENRSAEREEGHEHREQEELQDAVLARKLNETVQRRVDRTRALQHAERAADEENERDDWRRFRVRQAEDGRFEHHPD